MANKKPEQLTYEQIVTAMEGCSRSQLPGLLVTAVRLCIQRQAFMNPDAVSRFAKTVAHRYSIPGEEQKLQSPPDKS